MIPIRLREELHMDTADSYDLYTHIEDGKMFLCMEIKGYNLEIEIEKARELLAQANRS